METDRKLTANTLLSMINEETLSNIAVNTNANFHARKLTGEIMLQLIMQGILLFDNNLSQGVLKSYYESEAFLGVIKVVGRLDISKAAISKRIASLPSEYYRQIYESAVEKWVTFTESFGVESVDGLDLEAIDSTLVKQTTKILKEGIKGGRKKNSDNENPMHVKYTMGFNGKFATEAIVRLLPKYADEDNALGEAIINMVKNNPFTSTKSVYIFDRGIKGGNLITEFAEDNIRFVGRMNSNRRLEVLEKSSAPTGELPAGCTLLRDDIVNIYGKKHKRPLPTKLRVISVDLGKEIGKRSKGKKSTDTVITLITDEMEMSVAELLEIYRFRWKIEVFFKFLKQHFDLSHLMCGNENGLTSLIYITLLTALLVKIYCAINHTHIKTAQRSIWFEFREHINREIVKEVLRREGDRLDLHDGDKITIKIS